MRKLLNSLGDIWRLSVPYFTTRDIAEARIWPFRYRAQERWIGLALLVCVVGIELAQVAMDVRLSYWGKHWFNAIQEKNAPVFWKQLLYIFCPLAALYISSAVLQLVMRLYPHNPLAPLDDREDDGELARRLRALPHDADRRLERQPRSAYRRRHRQVHDDHLPLGLGLLSKATSLPAFAVILGDLVGGLHLPGHDLLVPGFLFWIALIYAILATVVTHLIGRPLINSTSSSSAMKPISASRLARLREYGEQVALLGGEAAEHQTLSGRFRALIGNFLNIVSCRKKVDGLRGGL